MSKKENEPPVKLDGPEREAFLREFREILKDVPPARKRGQLVPLKHFHDAIDRVMNPKQKPQQK